MPASKKIWIHDGSIAEYPSVLTGDSVHRGRTCTNCHDGDDQQSARAAAHVGSFQGITAASKCVGCHDNYINTAALGLHTTLAGYQVILGQRGFNPLDPLSMARFDEQCTRCHVAVGDNPPETACGHCHVSVPAPAGGGLLAGHAFEATPSMDNQCTACHGSRVKDEFNGSNNALLERNKPFLAAGVPWKEAEFTLEPDLHQVAGMECVTCHGMEEMHGEGAPVNDDRYAVTTAPNCQDAACHGGNLVGLNDLHTASHLDTMACQICHSQPYKNCFECHTDLTADTNIPFFTIAGGDPGESHDHLMTFRVGKNPKFVASPDKEYALLRHIPVDMDTFTYTGTNAQPGLLPQMATSPTWKYATPHNIQRVTPIQLSCNNCHGADYAKFWLTDALTNSEGWITTPYEADEQAANAGVIQSSAIPMTDTR